MAWLIREVGNRRAIVHRHEDMRRQQWGRWRGSSYRVVQLSSLTDTGAGTQTADEVLARHADRSFQAQAQPDDPHAGEDSRRAWRGLLALAARRFKPQEDVFLLLQLLAQDADIQASFGSEWPIAKIAAALNQRHPGPRWNDERVDNAKKRLRNWIGRLKQEHGFDAADLRDLLARYGREREAAAQALPARRPGVIVQTGPMPKGSHDHAS
ncbi:MAG TPA: hypothetical protein VEK73_20830 [Xanthobacteraceae bacterium]|nr:hypothetical protein [Xanthobacteraceae bacterium]